ncbi:hypothetical protein ACF1HU_36665, partial [Streptomyces olivaceus]
EGLAQGTVADVQPFARDLTGTVGADTRSLAGNAVAGAQGVTRSVTPDYLPVGAVTGLPVYDAAYQSTYNR